jgi:hypothetical protein
VGYTYGFTSKYSTGRIQFGRGRIRRRERNRYYIMRIGKIVSFCIIIILAINNSGLAQLIEIPVPRKYSNLNLRTKADSILIDLPLWDDFSTSDIIPDTSYWISGNAIFINPGIGINPPSINVATLDGWDAYGNPYNTDPELTGQADSLISRPLKLGSIPSSLQNTVYLSFYYQKQGNGDIPNEGDSLILQFKKPDGSWETVWPLRDEVVSTVSNFFTQKILQVPPEYLFDGFQFKFQSFGRLNGPFDTWNLDYVYLDKRRDINDISYLDRTFLTVPTSLFKPYSAIPIEHFFVEPEAFLDSSAIDFTNLERQVQPVEYSAITRDFLTGTPIDTLILDSAFLALRYPLGNVRLEAGLLDPLKLNNTADSIIMETVFYMDSGDNFLIDSISNGGLDTTRYQSVDLRVNDTTSVISYLSDYYAYDDGTAEFGAGINQLNGRLALMYITNTPDYITSIDINFLNIGRTAAGTPVQLYVLDSLTDNTAILETTSASAIVLDELDGFVNYTLVEPVFVTDTFYIGFQQTTADFLPVGLDKNTNTPGRIYLNVSGAWQQDTLTTGSLMMRPRFGEEVITSIADIDRDIIGVFPNPTSGGLQLLKVPDDVTLFDIRGVKVKVKQSGAYLDLSHLPPSVYLLRLKTNNIWSTHRILLKN